MALPIGITAQTPSHIPIFRTIYAQPSHKSAWTNQKEVK